MKPPLIGFFLTLIGAFAGTHAAAAPDIDAFFGFPDIVSATLSPSGELVATISSRDGGQRLSVTRLSDSTSRTLLELSELAEDDAIVNGIAWIDEKQLAVQYVEKLRGVERLIDSRRVSYLLIAQLPAAPDEKARLLRVRTKGRLVSSLPHSDDEFLYAKSGARSHVYRISTRGLSEADARLGKLDKVDGGQFIASNRVASVDGFALRWFIDKTGTPVSALTANPGFSITLNELDENGEFSEIKAWKRSPDQKPAQDDPLQDMI
ncbi:MAG: hypothetical protein AAGA33_12845, partial [Pseudomonadota bacterium]